MDFIIMIIVMVVIIISVLKSESLDVIKRDKLLTPTFTNKSNPDDIFTLPYGYEFYIKYYPKLDRTQR